MKPKLIPLQYEKPSLPEVAARARSFFEVMNRRRTVRDFSPARVPAGVIEDLVRAASTAPSGAHRQPWTFVAVSDRDIKRRIRIAAEREEHENYGGRMPDEWLRALEPLGTDEHKPFLEIAPGWWSSSARTTAWAGRRARPPLLCVRVGRHRGRPVPDRRAPGGTGGADAHPQPDGILREILKRPDNETACLLIPVGYPAADARVPDLRRKPLEDVLQILRD